MTVLISWQGGIHLIANSDWQLDRLAGEHGARTAYRVEHKEGRIAVDGMEAGTKCHLETEGPESRFKRLLRDTPRYQIQA